MEPEDSLQLIQEPTTCPYSNPEEIVCHIHKNGRSVELVTLCNPKEERGRKNGGRLDEKVIHDRGDNQYILEEVK